VSYTIPNEADAPTYPAQAEPDAGDFRSLGHAASGSGVLYGLQVAPGNSGVDRSVVIGYGRLVYFGWDHVAHPKTTIASGAIVADGTHPRWALIHSTDSGRTLTVSLGTAAANPVFPAVAELEVVLAAIYLPAAATSITAANIVDKRVLQTGSLVSTATYQPRALPPSAPKRASYARFGAPGYDGTNNLAANTAYTLYDSSDTNYGPVRRPHLSSSLTSTGSVLRLTVGPSPWIGTLAAFSHCDE
jgi:hypothetical protein